MERAREAAAKRQFEGFAAEASDTLLRTGYLMTGDARDAEDLVQETFLRVARRWNRVRSMDYPTAYARRILINLVLQDAERRSRQKAELAWQHTGIDAGIDAADQGAARALRHVDDLAEFRWALAQLTARQRAVLVLRSTLARTAADFESLDQARQRLLQRDYHPRPGNRRLAAGIIAGTAGVALVLSLGLSGVFGSASKRPGHSAPAQLAAWTVVKQADGTISITISEFRDAAGLQRTLRADGVRASVIFYPSKLPDGVPFSQLFHVAGNPCHPFSGGQGQLLKVVPPGRPGHLQENSVISVIHPSAIPGGAGIQFIATRNEGDLHRPPGRSALGVWLVQASPRCTGG